MEDQSNDVFNIHGFNIVRWDIGAQIGGGGWDRDVCHPQ